MEHTQIEYDWRPKRMHGQPRNMGSPACGCYMHYGLNFAEWIYCWLHSGAPELLKTCQSLLRILLEDEGYKTYNQICKEAGLVIAKATS